MVMAFPHPARNRMHTGYKTIATVIVGCIFSARTRRATSLNELSQAINKINKEETVILAGDLNCRIDITQDKAASVISYLENEGLSLINDKQEKTYICHNGSSTIDLIFSNMKRLHLTGREALNNVVIRKHLPTIAHFIMDTTQNTAPSTSMKYSRKLSPDQMRIEDPRVNSAIEHISRGDMDAGLETMENIIMSAMMPAKSVARKAQPWFNAKCYEARKKTISALHKARDSGLPNHLKEYSHTRRAYKMVLKETKQHMVQEEARLLTDAENAPFKALKSRTPRFPRDIPIQSGKTTFVVSSRKQTEEQMRGGKNLRTTHRNSQLKR
ncbi:hypothetical protein ANN_11030 [Periplaneta americana]|uniref:Endonuclease/exonuclease/phosphatase domain-containing protein n=1 Tax=Periplaneta americana TaxID=6978 RepID=A0ABQ8T3W1_PERAM|nr:hypothetical protein ANN_11030 [Periplaneta americana]